MPKKAPTKKILKTDPTADVGAAMLIWYAEAIREYPDGLITQAQAANMLNISRVAAGRLVSRGYLRAIYFPKPPDISGIAVGQDDPTWLKLIGRLSHVLGDPHTYAFPQACYVAFADVLKLWESGEAKHKCKRDWNEVMAATLTTGSRKSMNKSHAKLLDIHRDYQKLALLEREQEGGKKDE